MPAARTQPESKITEQQAYQRGRSDATLGRSGHVPYTDIRNAQASGRGWEEVKYARPGANSATRRKPLSDSHVYIQSFYMTTDQRHFLQQSDYTVCCKRQNNEWIYASHRESMNSHPENPDPFVQYRLPSSERERVLKLLLDTYNLNELSLFDSEESSMGTLAIGELIFSRHKYE